MHGRHISLKGWWVSIKVNDKKKEEMRMERNDGQNEGKRKQGNE